MRKIDLFQVLKSIAKKCWFPILLASIGACGMFFAAKIQQDQSAITWMLNNRYVISLSDRQDYNSYLYEEKMAAVINDLISRDEELSEMRSSLGVYSTKVSYRRIELLIQDQDEEAVIQAENLFFESAQKYLSEEFTQIATIAIESTSIKEVIQTNSSSKKDFVFLGAVLGMCIGLALLLLQEYVKSPKI
ncbi:MAG: hypothetical protein HDT27_02290, partial [Subdoligranulum sp.]|nr:hypothetical protein [Subdoligranulum sp.]